MDLAKLTIEIDSAPAKTGADQAVQSAERIKTSFGSLSPVQAKLVAEFRRLQEVLRQGGITFENYSRLSNQFTNAMSKGGRAAEQAVQSIQSVTGFTASSGVAAATASVKWDKLRLPLQQAAISFSAIPGPVGRVVGTLGLLSGGALLSVGVVAGMAAITLAIGKLTERSREAKKATDELIKSLRAARAEESGALFATQKGLLASRRAALEREILGNRITTAQQGTVTVLPSAARIAAIRKEITELYADEARLLRNRQEEHNKVVLAQLADEKRLAEGTERFARDAAAEKARLHAAELSALKLIADATGDPILKAYTAQLTLLDQLTAVASKLPPIFAEKLVGAIAAATAEVGHLAEVLETRVARALAVIGITPRVAVTGALQPATPLPSQRDPFAGEVVTRREEIELSAQARQASIDYAVSLGLVSYRTGRALSALSRMAEVIQEFGRSSKEAAVTIALAVAALANLVITGKSTGARIARGAIGGAGAGFVLGGPVGAAIGGVAGGLGGLLGGDGGQKSRDIEALTEAIKRFAEQARHLTPLQESLDRLEKEYKELLVTAKALGEPTRKIAQAYARQVQEAKDLFAQQEFAFQKGLEVRRLELEGTEAEAATAALALRQAEQIAEAAKQGYGAATTAVLQHVHALEKEKLALDQAVAAIQQKSEAEQFLGDLEARELALVGDKAGAARKRLENQALAAQREAEALFAAGTITEDIFDRLTGVINGELNVALEELGTTVDETGKQINAFVARAREDLEVRRLVALGLTEEAAARQVVLDQQREINTLIEQGADEATLALAKYVQSLEATAAWIDRVTAAEEKRLRVLELTARKEEDLAVRELRALGRTAGADELAQIQRNAAELRDALEQGLGQAVIDNIIRVQGIERGAADAARRAAQEEAFLKGSTSLGGGLEAESRTSFNAAVGITESQANRLAGLMQTQVVYQANLPDMRAALRELVQLARIGRGLVGSNLDIEAIDAALEGRSSSADRAAGLPPGNV
jgi:hypothetical protein